MGGTLTRDKKHSAKEMLTFIYEKLTLINIYISRFEYVARVTHADIRLIFYLCPTRIALLAEISRYDSSVEFIPLTTYINYQSYALSLQVKNCLSLRLLLFVV